MMVLTVSTLSLIMLVSWSQSSQIKYAVCYWQLARDWYQGNHAKVMPSAKDSKLEKTILSLGILSK